MFSFFFFFGCQWVCIPLAAYQYVNVFLWASLTVGNDNLDFEWAGKTGEATYLLLMYHVDKVSGATY